VAGTGRRLAMSVVFRWFPNSWFQIQGPHVVVHIDPAVSPSQPFEPPDDLLPADVVLITHHHRDHCEAASLGRVSDSNTLVFAPQLCDEELVGRRVTIVKPGDEFDAAGMHVRVVDAYNTAEGSSTVRSHVKGECVGYVISIAGVRVYHAGDTDLIPEMSQLGMIDVALLPVGGTYTMDAEEAARAVREIAPGVVVPMHTRGTDAQPFQVALKGADTAVVLLKPGGELDMDTDEE
jgi:L-ascorbate metabolism protein UlaG (beta-lactamase superfamily)